MCTEQGQRVINVTIGPKLPNETYWTLADALLADIDLQVTPPPTMATTSEYNSLNRQLRAYSQSSSSYVDNGRHSPLPPPVPPLPSSVAVQSDSRDIANGFYGGDSAPSPPVRQIYSSTITISKTVYDPEAANSCDDSNSVTRFHSSSPYNSLSRSRSQSSRHSVQGQTSPYATLNSHMTSAAGSNYSTQQRTYHSSPLSTLDRCPSGGAGATPSLVSGNLSELDNLLDDLSVSARRYSSLSREQRKNSDAQACSPGSGGQVSTCNWTTKSSSSPNTSSSGLEPKELEIPKLSDLVNLSPASSTAGSSRVNDASIRRQMSSQQSVLLQPPLVQSFPTTEPALGEPLVTNGRRSGTTMNGVVYREQHLQQQQAQPVNLTPSYVTQQHLQQQHYAAQNYDVLPATVGGEQCNHYRVNQSPSPGYGISAHGGTLSSVGSLGRSGFGNGGGNGQQFVVDGSARQHADVNGVAMQPGYSCSESVIVSRQTAPNLGMQREASGGTLNQQQHVALVHSPPPDFPRSGQARIDSGSLQRTLTSTSAARVAQRAPAGASAPTDLEELMASIAEYDKTPAKDKVDVNAIYAQPIKVKKSVSSDVTAESRVNGQRDVVDGGRLSASGLNGSDAAVHRHVVPSPIQLGSTIGSRMVGGGRLHGQLTGGVDTNGLPIVPQGDCAACGQTIAGPVLMALGKLWHIPHFLCAYCKRELGTSIFYEQDGFPYCEADYQNLFLPRCADCGGIIFENCITALNQTWHADHFRCSECTMPINEDRYYEKDGRPFCSQDYYRMYAPLCAGCDKPIITSYITALHQNWHSDCFVCNECQLPFDNSAFYELNGAMYCERHFYAHRGSVCATCSQPITGRSVTALCKKYHPDHFLCSFCLQPLNKGTFKEHSEKPYCHPCFNKLFG